MIKPPFLRIPRIDLLHTHAREKADELHADLESVAALMPFSVTDIETPGSAARGDWQFHSDLDLNFATGTVAAWDAARQAWRNYPDQSRSAMRRLNELSHKWGVRFEFSLQSPAVKDDPNKACWSWRERKMYHADKTTVISKYWFSYIDEDGNMHFNEDPYPEEEVEKWAAIYGNKYQHLGFTKDTEWIKRRGSTDIHPI